MKLIDYLGLDVRLLLQVKPFKSWQFDRSVERDLPETLIDYVCEAARFSMVCDANECIQTLFLQSPSLAYAELDLPAFCGRRGVHAAFGSPSQSGERSSHAILGESGAWDRYDREHHSIHIQYRLDEDSIEMLTLMHPDVVP